MEAMRGLGVDRHLFGLYVVAKGLKLDPMPKLFTDKVRLSFNCVTTHKQLLSTHTHTQAFNLSFTLSTSQTPVRFSDKWRADACSCCGGFGTVTEQGYGVSYMVVTEDEGRYTQGLLLNSLYNFLLVPIVIQLDYCSAVFPDSKTRIKLMIFIL